MTGTFFEGIPPVTVRQWVRKLGKRLVPCTPLERTYLTNQGFSKLGKLIPEDDLRALIHYPRIRRPYRKRHNLPSTSSLSSPSATEISVIDSNNLPSSSATSASVNQTKNGFFCDTQLQRTTDHPLNTDSNNLSSSSATAVQALNRKWNCSRDNLNGRQITL